MITQERLKEILCYYPKSGDLVWRVSQGSVRAGTQAGSLNKGYLRIMVDGKKYYAHVIAWLYMTGKLRVDQIDHKNLVRNDNVWDNLREADRAQQQGNRFASANNCSGYKGVSAFRNKFRAVIHKNKKQKLLGYYNTKAEASAAYKAAAQTQFGEFARA